MNNNSRTRNRVALLLRIGWKATKSVVSVLFLSLSPPVPLSLWLGHLDCISSSFFFLMAIRPLSSSCHSHCGRTREEERRRGEGGGREEEWIIGREVCDESETTYIQFHDWHDEALINFLTSRFFLASQSSLLSRARLVFIIQSTITCDFLPIFVSTWIYSTNSDIFQWMPFSDIWYLEYYRQRNYLNRYLCQSTFLNTLAALSTNRESDPTSISPLWFPYRSLFFCFSAQFCIVDPVHYS